LDQGIAIHDCDEFRVIRNNVAGDSRPSRIERELNCSRLAAVARIFIQQPQAVVIYRDVPTRRATHIFQMPTFW